MNRRNRNQTSFKRKFFCIITLILACGILNLGTIRKKDDPIARTQTNPITFKQKQEELKDGPKGAPAPSFTLYPKTRFLMDPPVSDKSKESPKPDQKKLIEPAPEEVQYWEEDKDGKGEEDWWSENNDESTQDKPREEDAEIY